MAGHLRGIEAQRFEVLLQRLDRIARRIELEQRAGRARGARRRTGGRGRKNLRLRGRAGNTVDIQAVLLLIILDGLLGQLAEVAGDRPAVIAQLLELGLQLAHSIALRVELQIAIAAGGSSGFRAGAGSVHRAHASGGQVAVVDLIRILGVLRGKDADILGLAVMLADPARRDVAVEIAVLDAHKRLAAGKIFRLQHVNAGIAHDIVFNRSAQRCLGAHTNLCQRLAVHVLVPRKRRYRQNGEHADHQAQDRQHRQGALCSFHHRPSPFPARSACSCIVFRARFAR